MKKSMVIIGLLALGLMFQGRAAGSMVPCFDLNNDGIIDVLDIMMVESRWGLTAGTSAYDPIYDLDADGEIDLIDVGMVANLEGEPCAFLSPATGGQTASVKTDLPRLWLRAPQHPIPLTVSFFTVDAIVSNVADLGHAEFRLTYDPVIVEATEITLTEFLGRSGRTTGEFDPANGYQMLAPGLIGFLAYSYGDQPGVGGEGLLATITLSPQAVGTTDLSLAHNLMANTGDPWVEGAYQTAVPIASGTQITVADCIAGDLNCSGTVDVSDIMLVATRWGTSEANRDPDDNLATPNYNPLYDVDGDHGINVVDIQTVAALWGSTGS